MPQLGETVTEGTITKWMKKVGDPVEEDEVLFEVSTDKVDSEVPSPSAGVVTEILVDEGETVDVGTKLAVISPAGSKPAPAAPPESKPEAGDNGSTAPIGSGRSAAVQDNEEEGEAPEFVPEPESVGALEPESVSAAPPPAAPARTTADAVQAASTDEGGSKLLSPVVRKLVSEHNLDPGEIRGTGPGGRITRADVLAVIDRRNGGAAGATRAGQPSPAAQTAEPAAPGQPAPRVGGAPVATSAGVQSVAAPQLDVGEHDSVVPFTNIRRRTAEHMVRSKHTSAHTMVAVEVDYSAVEKVRNAEKNRFKEAEGFSLTYLPFVTRAVVDALEEFPNVNSSVGDDALIVHGDVNIGIAVDLDFEGLLVPVIHNADGRRLRTLAREISALAGKARSKRLTMDDISGGTFTITNAGPFGTFITVPVINQPQVAILSTDGVVKKPVAVELPDGTDGIAVHPVGNLVMSWDHRAFDGAYAAAFLRAVKNVIETRDWAAEL